MATATKTTSKTREKAHDGFSEEQTTEAIKSTFSQQEGQISIRYLWTSEGVHRFRVNWWSPEQGAIKRSEFVRVIEVGKKLTVKVVKNDDNKPSS